jgi:hypothetical protein
VLLTGRGLVGVSQGAYVYPLKHRAYDMPKATFELMILFSVLGTLDTTRPSNSFQRARANHLGESLDS